MSAPLSASLQAAARIDGEWDFDDPAASQSRFEALLEEAAGRPDGRHFPGFRGQVLTQIARALALQRRFDAAHTKLGEVEAMLAGAGRGRGGAEVALLRVRYLLERGRVLNSSGETARARPLFVDAWRRARRLGADFYAADAAHMVAAGGPMGGRPALDWNRKALAAALASSDPRARGWEASLCNNLAWTLHERGDLDGALALFERALAARRRLGTPNEVRVARWCVARCLRSLGHVEEALAAQQALLEERAPAAGPDGYVHEEIAECLEALGRRDQARPHFAAAHRILSGEPWLAQREPGRLRRLALLAGGGEPA